MTCSGDGQSDDIQRSPKHGLRRSTSQPLEETIGCSTARLTENPNTSPMQRISLSKGTPRFEVRQIHTTRHGKPTMKNDSMFTWGLTSRGSNGCSTSGKNKTASAQF